MKPVHLIAALSLAVLLAGCGKKAETDATVTVNSSPEAASSKKEDMGNMTMPSDAAAKMAKANGTVTAIDKAGGTITLDHGPIPEVNWPAMTMAFKAKPELLASVKVGDKVAAELSIKGSEGEILAISKQ